MIPAIGLIIGAYTLVRFLEIIFTKENTPAYVFIKLMAFLAGAVTVLCLIDLVTSGANPPPVSMLER